MHTVFVFLALWIASAIVSAEQVYRYVDDSGKMYFTDKPPEQTGRTGAIVDVRSLPTPTRVTGLYVQKQKEIGALLEQERLLRERSKANLMRKKKQRQRECHHAQDKLDEAEYRPAVYHLDEQGERTYLDRAGRAAYVQFLRSQVEQFCE